MAFNLIYWTPICGKYFFLVFPLGKMGGNMEKRLFFRAAMAGLGKYHMGGYGRIGVDRVNEVHTKTVTTRKMETQNLLNVNIFLK